MMQTRTARIALGACALALAAMALSGCVRDRATASLPTAQLAGPRVLVIAPHPDDEGLAAGGAIKTALDSGATVKVVVVTCGDGFIQAVRRAKHPNPTGADMQAYGARRAAETRRATAALGLPAHDVIFLGFADVSLKTLWTSGFTGKPVRCANGADHVPYAFAYRPNAPYTGRELLGEVEAIIRRERPTTIIYPDASDANRDHWATSAFVQTALRATGYTGGELTYLVHRPGYPNPLADTAVLAPPDSLAQIERWTSLPLPASVAAAKLQAVDSYRTQLAADGTLLRRFLCGNEVFASEPVPSLGSTSTVLAVSGAGMPKTATPAAAKVRGYAVRRDGRRVDLDVLTLAPPTPDVTYLIHARTLLANGTLRFYDASVSGGRLAPSQVSALDVGESGEATVSAGGTTVSLPPSLTRDARWLLLSVDTSAPAGTLLDHGPWRAVRIGL